MLFITSRIKNNHKSKIPIAYATDNNYTYPTLVSMTSLLERIQHHKTFYDIYIMINNDFTQDNKDKLKSIEEHYPHHCTITFINMTNMYMEQNSFPKSKYYRLALHDKLPYIDKIIYLDGDTMIFEDLTELNDLNMKGYYILGFLDSLFWALEIYGIKNAIVLNSGVLLMNLKALRDNNITYKFNQFMKNNNNSVIQEDQTIINYVLQKNISKLPPKYGMWAFDNIVLALEHNKIQRPWLKYNIKKFKLAFEHPAILHYTGAKPYKDKDVLYYSIWWNYAKKTGFYDDIYHYYLDNLKRLEIYENITNL